MGQGATKVGFLLWCSVSWLSAQTIDQQVDEFVAQSRAAQGTAIPEALFRANASEVAKSSMRYVSDSIPQVRASIYMMLARTALQTNDQLVRQSTVSLLIDQKKDQLNNYIILTYLAQFGSNDFSGSARDSVASWVRSNPHYLDQLIRLSGALGIQQLVPDLKTLSGPATRNQKIRWSALLALSRLGDKQALDEVMRRAQRLPLNDDVVYEVFPDLVYTRQRAAIDYLLAVIDSNEKKCTTADAADETLVICAYRVMEMLAPVIEGFPVKTDASGDLITSDYEHALKLVRQWSAKNKGNYRILGSG